jgi:hypothetical protein
MRLMHVNDIANCWWKSDFMYDQHWACESCIFPGTFYHSVAHWKFV